MDTPVVMGIVNATPDSFSDGGRFMDADAAVELGRRLVGEGAGLLDVGGESSRPGAEPVSGDEELRRVLPVVERLAAEGARSRSTPPSSTVARAALAAGATIVNDVSAFRFEPELAGAGGGRGRRLLPGAHARRAAHDAARPPLRRRGAPRCAPSSRSGWPSRSPRALPRSASGSIPGSASARTLEHNLELLRRLDEIVAIGRPVVVGTSRKSFLGKLAGGREPDERLPGTIATNVLALERGASVFRVHDVGPVVDALAVAAATVRR